MNPINRLGLAVLLVAGVGLLGSTTAWARSQSYSIELTNVGDEPQALGAASFTVTKVTIPSPRPYPPPVPGHSELYYGKLTVTCVNLTPGATYRTPAGTFTADATGAGSVSAKVTLGIFVADYYVIPAVIDVVRLNPDNSTTTVLTGEFWGQWGPY